MTHTARQGCPRVEDGLGGVGDGAAARREAVQRDLVVRLRGEGHVGEGARVVGGVRATDRQLAVVASGLQVEGEDRLVDDTLLHHRQEDGLEVVDGDRGKCEAQNAIECCEVCCQVVSHGREEERNE